MGKIAEFIQFCDVALLLTACLSFPASPAKTAIDRVRSSLLRLLLSHKYINAKMLYPLRSETRSDNCGCKIVHGTDGEKRDIYAAQDSSIAPRVFLTITAGASLGIAWWLLFAEGILSIGTRFGWGLKPGEEARRLCLGLALSAYFVRLLFTQFVFLKRAVSWSEAFMIAPWLFCIYLLFALGGGTNSARLTGFFWLGIVLFIVGSWLNSYAEYARHAWKQRAENHGRLYTLGLFRYARHPNYLGDLISFTGLCLIAGRWTCVAIPIIMLAGFVFANIPMLDSHLHDHYGAAFDHYAARTRKLIPFVY